MRSKKKHELLQIGTAAILGDKNARPAAGVNPATGTSLDSLLLPLAASLPALPESSINALLRLALA